MPRVRRGSNLTIKEQGFVQDLVKGKSIRRAIQNNYNVKNATNASVMGNTMMHNPRIQYAIMDLMDRQGVSDIRLVDRMKHFIFDAKKQVLDKDGGVVELVDNQASLKALDMAMKIKGAYAPERHEVLGVNLTLYQELSDEELDRRLQLVAAREALTAGGEGAKTGS